MMQGDKHLYSNIILSKGDEDYVKLIKSCLEYRLQDCFKTLAVFRDRGKKYGFINGYRYDLQGVYGMVNEKVEKGEWFVSLYLSWLLHETEITNEDLTISFDTLVFLCETGDYQEIIKVNRYECYGFCMGLLTLLDKIYFLKINDTSVKLPLIRLVLIGITTYLSYHKNKNSLWDAEMFSNYARLFDAFRDTIVLLFFEGNFPHYPNYSYCFGMYYAWISAPRDLGYKHQYHQNALMMHQNQTVGGVTGDAMDGSLDDAVQLGKRQFDEFCKLSSLNNLVQQSDLLSLRDLIMSINESYLTRIKSQPGFDGLRYLERYFQLEPYDKYGIIAPIKKEYHFHYNILVNNLGLQPYDYEITNRGNNKLLHTKNLEITPRMSSSAPVGNPFTRTFIAYVSATLNKNDEIISMSITGLHLHDFFIDISRCGLFYGIPCKVGSFMPYWQGGLDMFSLVVGTNDVM